MFLVGLTGGIATGKSTVSKMFQELGCPLVDADKVAREVVEPGMPAWKKIRDHFGDNVILWDGRLHRDRLGKIIFADPDKRKLLNSITHPEIYKAMMWKLLGYWLRGQSFVIMDLPLLFESNRVVPYCSYIVVVSCDEETQLRRLKERNNYSEEDARQRIEAQMPLADKCKRATYIIDNSGDFEATKAQVLDIYKKLQSSKRHWRLRILLLGVLMCVLGIGWLSWRAAGR